MALGASTNQSAHLIILSSSQSLVEPVIRDLESLKADFPHLTYERIDAAQAGRLKGKIDLVVLEVDRWTDHEQRIVFQIRESGLNCPILVAYGEAHESMRESGKFQKVVFFARGLEREEMLKLIRQLVQGPPVASRKHLRHATDEPAEIQIEGQVTKIKCRVKNISKGGALLQMAQGDAPVDKLAPGQRLHLKFTLKSMNRNYSVKARIAWSDQLMFGVEFLLDEGKK